MRLSGTTWPAPEMVTPARLARPFSQPSCAFLFFRRPRPGSQRCKPIVVRRKPRPTSTPSLTSVSAGPETRRFRDCNAARERASTTTHEMAAAVAKMAASPSDRKTKRLAKPRRAAEPAAQPCLFEEDPRGAQPKRRSKFDSYIRVAGTRSAGRPGTNFLGARRSSPATRASASVRAELERPQTESTSAAVVREKSPAGCALPLANAARRTLGPMARR